MQLSTWNQMTFISKWYNVPDSEPHITLLINNKAKARDLGPMMKDTERAEWEATDNPLIFQTRGSTMIKILCRTSMLATPQEVNIMAKILIQRDEETKETENMLEDMLKRVPESLWPKDDFDVGLVKSAKPVKIDLQPWETLSNRRQCPLKAEADEGISRTLSELIKAGALVEMYSPCNTPIFPVLKAVQIHAGT